MEDKIIVKARGDHVAQWAHLKRLYIGRRGSDPDKNNKAVPRTTNADVAQLAKYWHGEYRRVDMRGFPALDRSKASRARWLEGKAKVDKQFDKADPTARYSNNEWFWQDATSRLAIYLESLKAVPSRTELAFDAVTETLSEHGDRLSEVADVAAEVGSRALDVLKAGALIAGGMLGVTVVIPSIVRAFRARPGE